MRGQWSYGTIEWLWQAGQIRQNLAGQPEQMKQGSYQEVVELLTQLGHQGWEVCACVSGGDWVYWTLKYQHIA